MSKYRVEVVDSIQAPTHLKSGSRVFLDLGEFGVNMSKAASKLTEGKVIDEVITGGAVPFSQLNDIVFYKYSNNNLIDNQRTPLTVNVFLDGATINAAELWILNVNDESQVYEVEIRRGAAHWLQGADDKFLNSINFGTFEYTQPNVIANWANNEYTNGTTGVYFPVCDYGQFYAEVPFSTQQYVHIEDLRPWFHALYVLQKGFCEIGWNFECPALETSFGRTLITYILKENFGRGEARRNTRLFKARTDGIVVVQGIVQLNIEDFDNGNYFDGQYFNGPGLHNFFYQGVATVVNPTASAINAEIGFIFDEAGNQQLIPVIVQSIPAGSTVNININISLSSIPIFDVWRIGVYMLATGGTISTEGVFYNEVIEAALEDGDTIILKDEIHPDYTLLDFTKGIQHLLKGRFVTDWVNKTVTLYTPYDVDFYGDSITGFYQDTVEVLTPRILEETRQQAIKESRRKRYYEIGFSDSKDNYIDSLDLDDDIPIFGKRIDFGSDYAAGTKKDENPFFEPTYNKSKELFAASKDELDLPALWDNNENERSAEIGPRILIAYGYEPQMDGVTEKDWNFEGTEQQDFPYAFQVANAEVLSGAITQELTYRDDGIYQYTWKKDLFTNEYSAELKLKLLTNIHEYKAENFRNRKEIYYKGRTFLARADEVTDFDSEQATYLFLPIPTISDECNIGSSTVCVNNPAITVTPDLANDRVKAVGDDTDVASAIDTSTFEYTIDGGSNWLPYTPDTWITGEPNVIFRRILTFTDTCPDAYVSANYNIGSECNNEAAIELTYDGGTNTIEANGTENFNSPVSSDTWEVNEDGGGYIGYTEGASVSGFTTITFRRTIVFTNSCPDVVITSTYTVPDGEAQCNNAPTIEISAYGECVNDIAIGGTTSSTIFMSIIQISRDGGTTYFDWDRQPFECDPNIIIKAVVKYTDACPETQLQTTVT